MASPSPEYEAFQKTLEGHQELRDLLARIEAALKERTISITEVSDLLGLLGDRLIKHFAMEEEGGYFAEALTHAPRLISRANALLLQHPKMTEQARKLAGVADPDSEPDRWWQQTSRRFDAFKEELFKHEKREDTLVQEAYIQDIGSQD